MNIKFVKIIVSFLIVLFALHSCASNQWKKANKPFKHITPLIKEDIRKVGKGEIDKTIRMGPNPVFGDTVLLNKRECFLKGRWVYEFGYGVNRENI